MANFKGKVIDDDTDAINGDREDKHLAFIDQTDPTDQTEVGVCGENSICHLDPPFSCYLCPKFQPYRHADHEHVLERLLVDRDTRLEKYENARLGIQLDQVIVAVAQVVGYMKGKSAIHIARNYLGQRKNYGGMSFWARGYFVSTVGTDEEVVRAYIRDQEKEDNRVEQMKLF